MIKFRLATLNSAEVTPDVLAMWEVAAFFIGESTPHDLPIDEDQAREWYIENIVEAASKSDYIDEPQMADAEMIESFSNWLAQMSSERSEALGVSYPFELDRRSATLRRKDGAVDITGGCYLALQFFRGLSAGTIEIAGTDDKDIKKQQEDFDKLFRKVFEYISGYAVSGKTKGAPHMTSHCRSAQKLEGLLCGVCRKVGAGAVKPFGIWNIVQKAANDGGVDCLVHVGGPGAPGDAELLLVGATVQKNNISQKIMGPEKVDFVRGFFSAQPAAFKGILVRPQDEDPLTVAKCVDKDCLLYSYEQIWKNMAATRCTVYQSRMLLRVDAKVRKLLRGFLGSSLLYEYEEHEYS